MKSIAMKRILPAVVLTLTAGLSGHAAAGEVNETVVRGHSVPSVTVTYSRAELATADGRAYVERRIRKAAEKVCGSRDLRIAGSLYIVARSEACYDDALAKGMSQLHSEQVASLD